MRTHIFFIFLAVAALLSVVCEARKKDKDLLKSAELLKKETERLSKAGVTCPHNIVTLSTLDRLRITEQYDKALACHIKYLTKNSGDSWVWSSLGTTYLLQGSSKSTSKASTHFKSAAKKGPKLGDQVRQWHYLGPFVIGKNELDGDPVEAYGGIREASKNRYNKQERYASELAPDGQVGWLVYKQDTKSEMILVFPKIDWNDFVNSLGSTAILEWQGWIVGEFAVNEDGLNVIIQCLGVTTVFVDDIPITGDVYHRDAFWFSVALDRGIHTLYIRLRAKARSQFKCTIDSAQSTFTILKPHYLPDLYNGYLFGSHIALPISNYNTKGWLRNIQISVDSQSQGTPLSVINSELGVSIAPGQTRPIRIQLGAESGQILTESCSDVDLRLRVSSSEGEQVHPLTLRCRKPGESFLFTFVDHDGSVQQAAVIEPLESCSQGPCPVLLTLHGTTVSPQSQADSYKHMVDGEYVFGLPKAWVLAPTRHGAHNWEGPGILTAIQALDSLSDLSSSKEWLKNKASSQHVIFAGHSMGGHGAWNLATHLPDRALAVISLAGWIKKEDYGDSNLFFKHDIATTYIDPATKAVLEACITESESDRLAPNLQGLSVLVRVGAADRTIHPFYPRRMLRVLQDLGINVTFSELPAKEHWWWDTWETNDGGAVHDAQLRNFTNYYSVIPESSPSSCEEGGPSCLSDRAGSEAGVGEGAATKYQEPSSQTERFSYITTNPAFGESVRGLRVLQQITPFRTSSIQAEVTTNGAELVTVNVLRFTISIPLNRPVNWWNKDIKIDGQQILIANVWKDESLCICRDKGMWKMCSDCGSLEPLTQRGPSNLGPARRVAERPFLIVTGTQSTHIINRHLLEFSVYIGNLFFLTSDSDAPILTDVELTEEVAAKYNLIILGSTSENSWTSRYLDKIPLEFESNSFKLGACQFGSSPSGALFLAPHGAHLALVLMGDSLDALQDVVSLATPTIPPMTRSPFSNLIPDFVITGPTFRGQGPAGYSCVGFWGNSWEFRPDLASCSYCYNP